MFVQTVKGKTVVDQSRRLKENLASDLKVDFGPLSGYCLGGCQELIEGWAGVGRRTARLSMRLESGKRI